MRVQKIILLTENLKLTQKYWYSIGSRNTHFAPL